MRTHVTFVVIFVRFSSFRTKVTHVQRTDYWAGSKSKMNPFETTIGWQHYYNKACRIENAIRYRAPRNSTTILVLMAIFFFKVDCDRSMPGHVTTFTHTRPHFFDGCIYSPNFGLVTKLFVPSNLFFDPLIYKDC